MVMKLWLKSSSSRFTKCFKNNVFDILLCDRLSIVSAFDDMNKFYEIFFILL